MRTLGLFLLAVISPLLPMHAEERKDSVKTLSAIGVRADIGGPILKLFGSDFMQYEASGYVGVKNRFFPTLEIGYGTSDYTSETTKNTSKTRALYYRIGMDYNFIKRNKYNSRFTAGLRYGLSIYNYDITAPDFQDKVWKVQRPLVLNDVPGSAHWLEVVAGVGTKLWRMIYVGWSVRFKFLLAEKANEIGSPYYIPGYGTKGDTTWGGSFYVGVEF